MLADPQARPIVSDQFAAPSAVDGGRGAAAGPPLSAEVGHRRPCPAQVGALEHKVDVNRLEHHGRRHLLALNEIGLLRISRSTRPLAFDRLCATIATLGGFILIDKATHATRRCGDDRRLPSAGLLDAHVERIFWVAAMRNGPRRCCQLAAQGRSAFILTEAALPRGPVPISGRRTGLSDPPRGRGRRG